MAKKKRGTVLFWRIPKFYKYRIQETFLSMCVFYTNKFENKQFLDDCHCLFSSEDTQRDDLE